MKIWIWHTKGHKGYQCAMYENCVNVRRMQVKNTLIDKLISSLKEVDKLVFTFTKKKNVNPNYYMWEQSMPWRNMSDALKPIFLSIFSRPLYLLYMFTILELLWINIELWCIFHLSPSLLRYFIINGSEL